ncbi:MAG: DUF362 domain-containing protein [Bilifractor sp.]|jgi:uncharacterized protein (DUF362 family)/ferredoxin
MNRPVKQERNHTVAAAACPDYSVENVRSALTRVLEPLGGLSFVRPGMKIAIKVNLIAARAPEKAATTNPVLVAELARMLKERGAEVIVGDSPGGTYTASHLNGVYRTCGLAAAEEAGARLNEDFSVHNASFPEGKAAKQFSYTGWLDDADQIIDFCKLKTHGMLKMTCAVKNMFGTIPGMTKPEYHMRFPEIGDFADMLIDLNEYFRPAINIVDAVDCMEGNGPTAGTKRHIGLLLASESPYDLDVVCAHLIGLSGKDVATISRAAARGLGPASFEETKRAGDDITPFVTPDFQTDIHTVGIDFSSGIGPMSRIANSVMNAVFATRPQVKPDECVGCAQCAKVCPAKAISMRLGKPEIDRSRCIRCFCCQEFCPKGAMKVHHTWIGTLVRGVTQSRETPRRNRKTE